MTAAVQKSVPEISVSKQAVEGFVSSVTQKATAMKQRMAQKIDSVPVLKKIADKVKSFDDKMSEKYGKTYKRARNIALGVGIAVVAAKAGTVGLTALCAVNAARCLAPIMAKAEKDRQEGKATGILDYMGKHKTESVFAVAGAAISAGAAIAGLTGSESISHISRASGATLAATANISDIGQTAAKAVKGQASWKDVGDSVLAAGLTAAAYYLGSEKSNENTAARQTDSVAPTPVQDVPAQTTATPVTPEITPQQITPDPIPAVEPTITPTPQPAPEIVPQQAAPDPIIEPVITPAPAPAPAPEPVAPAPVTPDIDMSHPDPDLDPSTYKDNSDVFVQKSFIQGDRTTTLMINKEVDGNSLDSFYSETKSAEGGKYVQSAVDGNESVKYVTPDGKEIDLSKHEEVASKNMDSNHDGRISAKEMANSDKKLHTILTKEYGADRAGNIMEARNHFELDGHVTSETFSKLATPPTPQHSEPAISPAAAAKLPGRGGR